MQLPPWCLLLRFVAGIPALAGKPVGNLWDDMQCIWWLVPPPHAPAIRRNLVNVRGPVTAGSTLS